MRSQKELALDDVTAVANDVDDDVIKSAGSEITRLKEIPVPQSVASESVHGVTNFERPRDYLRQPKASGSAAGSSYSSVPYTYVHDDRVDWDLDPAGFRFLNALNNKGEKGGNFTAGIAKVIEEYSGGAITEELMERIIDRFEKSVKLETVPALSTLEEQLSSVVPDAAVVKAMYTWWVERRKFLAQPLIRSLRPPPDPEDPDTTGVAFRPREQQGVRRQRTNNKKTFALMTQLRDEFRRLRQILELVKRRERLKLEFHRAAGEYTEAAHRTLLNRLVRQRTDPRAVWKDDLEETERKSHKKQMPPPSAPSEARSHHRAERSDRSHKKRHDGPRDSHRSRDRDRDRSHRAERSDRHAGQLNRSNEFSHIRQGEGSGSGDMDEVDSEEEAYARLLLSVDMAQRDVLERMLPRHLREVQAPSEPTTASAAPAAPPVASAGAPSVAAGFTPGIAPSLAPGFTPGAAPSLAPGFTPGAAPSVAPGFTPGAAPSVALGFTPGAAPSVAPSVVLASGAPPPGVRPVPVVQVATGVLPPGVLPPGVPAVAAVLPAPSVPPAPSAARPAGVVPSGGEASGVVEAEGVAPAGAEVAGAGPTQARAPAGAGGVLAGPVPAGVPAGAAARPVPVPLPVPVPVPVGVPETAASREAQLAAQQLYRVDHGSETRRRGRGIGTVRIGRGGRVLFDRSGGSSRNYKHVCFPPLLQHVMRTGRMGAPSLLEPQVDPDEAWRQNRPLKIPRGPKLFDFAWLPKPELLPPRDGLLVAAPPLKQAEPSQAVAAAGQANGVVNGEPAAGARKRKSPDTVNGPAGES